MSQEVVAQFMSFAKDSPETQEQLRAAKTQDDVVSIASSSGYQFSADDLNAYGKARASNSELSDEQLEGAAGGITNTMICITWTLI